MASETNSITKRLKNFKKDIDSLKSPEIEKTAMQIFGIERSELSHSNFLAWFLSPKSGHGLNELPLTLLLQTIAEKTDAFPEQLTGVNFRIKIANGEFKLTNISVDTEKYADKKNRFDIYISADIKTDDCVITPFVCIIENKIKSSEGKEQIKRYCDILNEMTRSVKLGLYLVPVEYNDLKKTQHKLADEEYNSGGMFTLINYQFLLENVLEPVLPEIKSEKVKNIVNEYISSLFIKSFEMSNSLRKKEYPIMAMDEKTRKELLKFYVENEDTLKNLCEALTINPQSTDEDKMNQEKISDAMKKAKLYFYVHKVGEVVDNKTAKEIGVYKTHLGHTIARFLVIHWAMTKLSLDEQIENFKELADYVLGYGMSAGNPKQKLLVKFSDIGDRKGDYHIKEGQLVLFNNELYCASRHFDGDTNQGRVAELNKFIQEKFGIQIDLVIK